MDNTLLERLDRIRMPAYQLADAKARALKAGAFVDFVFGLHERSGSRGHRLRHYVVGLVGHARRAYRPA